jgi:hypothetical protein
MRTVRARHTQGQLAHLIDLLLVVRPRRHARHRVQHKLRRRRRVVRRRAPGAPVRIKAPQEAAVRGKLGRRAQGVDKALVGLGAARVVQNGALRLLPGRHVDHAHLDALAAVACEGGRTCGEKGRKAQRRDDTRKGIINHRLGAAGKYAVPCRAVEFFERAPQTVAWLRWVRCTLNRGARLH